ncbi:MAG: hypothetical protein K0R51_3225 [Cytophagaceae bacterium]|jgi:DNA recombination protein RmuC|nr:hypothetical protein [Cytophagaceae bacterium]
MEITLLIIGLLAGFGMGYFYTKSKVGSSTDLEVQENQERELNNLRLEHASLKAKFEDATKHIAALQADLQLERAAVRDIHGKLTASEADLKNSQEKLVNQKQELEGLHKTLLDQFQTISIKALRDNASDFNTQSHERLQTVLNPLKEKIEGFEKKVQETYEKSLVDNTTLKEQIKTLSELNHKISEDAINLTQALLGEKKTQGNWGEMLLESLLEKSGLEKGTQYVTQGTLEGEDGSKLRPDVIINLPDNKHLIIDSKVSLVDYNEYSNALNEELRGQKLRDHITRLKVHCTSLGGKRYDTLYNINSPDYVLMFIPIEPAFTIAMQNDTHLFLWALERNVVLVTSSTLLATLRTVASIWKQENQKKNVLEIAEESGKLYDKFVGFLSDMKSIGAHIDKSKESYEASIRKLTLGPGNMVSKVEYLKKLGAKATKAIDSKLLDDESDN